MKNKLDDDLRDRTVRAFLDMAILAKLKGEPLNGYNLTNFFIKKFGAIISTSAVYSTLYSMERNGLINGKYDRRSRIYELTEKGKKKLEQNRNTLEQIQALLKKLLVSY